jgi:chromosome partitioning protein
MNMASLFGARSSQQPATAQPPVAVAKQAHIIVVGNEKGGCGKTTTCMHLIVALMRLGFKVGTMDIDSRQRSLSRYIENRRLTMAKHHATLPMPHHIVITKSPFTIQSEAEEDERDRFNQGLARIVKTCDFVVIDGPGSDTFLSRLAHSSADMIITPINDSFVDLDLLASVDGDTLQIIRPSIYSEMVWEQKLARAKRDSGSIEWIVMRNRLSNLDARNKRQMKKVTEELARRIGFRLAPGFSERVIFREMFLQGLTVLDVMDTSMDVKITISHIAARQEVRDLLKTLRIPEIDRRINELRHAEENEGAAVVAKPEAASPSAASAPVASEPAVSEQPAPTPAASLQPAG